ncbi:MAG: type II secretion system F family protein [Thioalkalivibrio sp.]|nr:type II secretion system F family protein [Thioalkalivibrio sp.]
MSAVRTYYYRVMLPHGAVRGGFYRLAVEQDFSARVRIENEFDGVVVSLWRLPRPLAAIGRRIAGFFRAELRPEDLAGFLRDLGVMMRAGIPQLEALQALIQEGDTAGSRSISRVARHLHDDLDAGATVSQAFDRRPDIFPETVRNLVSIGDQSGNLDRMLIEAAEHTERMINIRRDVRTALIYPAFVFATIIGVAIFWISYVVPTMGDLFRQLNAELPAITTGLVAFSDVVAEHLVWVLLLLVALIVGGLPVTRVLATSSGMAALSENLSILARSGIDMVSSLRILGNSTSDLYYRERLERVRESVVRGESVGAAMREAGGFPAMAVRMIAVGEESGTLDEQLTQLAAEYRKRLEVVIASISEILKPLIILVAGGLFFFLIVALLLPIYDLIRQAMQITGG